MGLELDPGQQAEIRRHGEETFPHECCGFLLGSGAGDRRSVFRLARADNERADSARNRYLISPEAYLAAEREAEQAGLEIVGFYHSHPDAGARPSEFDRDHALPGVSYVIVSVRDGEAREVTSWALSVDHSRFDPEAILESNHNRNDRRS